MYTAKDERRDEGDTASPRSKTKVSSIRLGDTVSYDEQGVPAGW